MMTPYPIRSIWTGLLIGAGICLAVSQAEAVRNPIPGSTIRIEATGTVQSLDPTQAATAAERLLVANLFDRLVRRGPDGNWQPSAAASWQASSDSLVWTFVLRPEMTFTDGRPVTAEAVIRSADTPEPAGRGAGRLVGATWSADGGRVVLRFSEEAPVHLLEKLADPAYGIKAQVVGPNGGSLVGSGPFRLARSPKPGEFVLVPRLDHRLGRAMPAGIVVTSRPGQIQPFAGLSGVRGVIEDPASGTLDFSMAFVDSASAP